MQNEIALYEQISQYLNLKHPGILYHWDLSGVHNASRYTRNLYGRLNVRGFPDLIIYQPHGAYAGLAIEVKVAGTVVYKKDGTLRASTHLAEQEAMLQRLRAAQYRAEFACGYDEITKIIEDYVQN